MQLTLHLSFKTFFLCLITMGCASNQTSNKRSFAETQKVFFASYESTWRAAQLALKYPLAFNNMDTGIIETEWIKADEGFQSPIHEEAPSAGIRYKIAMSFVKGKFENKNSVKVKITKKIERHRDFFSEPEVINTDGLEEKVLFYRMEREILIEEGLKKSSKT